MKIVLLRFFICWMWERRHCFSHGKCDVCGKIINKQQMKHLCVEAVKEKKLKEFYIRFQEEYPHLDDEQAEEIKKFITKIIDESYQQGEDDYIDSISNT